MKIRQEISHYIAEAIGVFCLVFFICGAVTLAELDPQYNGSLIPVIAGGVVSVMIYALGHLSGAHINPAVTLAFWSLRRISGRRVLGYIVAQLLGALMASFVHWMIWGGGHQFGATSLTVSPAMGFGIEILISFILMFVVTSVATDSRALGEHAAIAIGLTVALCAFVAGPLTGASMNPARTLGPALFSGQLQSLWVYCLGPIIGTTLGALSYQGIKCF